MIWAVTLAPPLIPSSPRPRPATPWPPPPTSWPGTPGRTWGRIWGGKMKSIGRGGGKGGEGRGAWLNIFNPLFSERTILLPRSLGMLVVSARTSYGWGCCALRTPTGCWGSRWTGRRRSLSNSGENCKHTKQAGVELGHAQIKLGLDCTIIFGRFVFSRFGLIVLVVFFSFEGLIK